MSAKSVLVVLTIGLASCATQKSIYLPDGRKGHSINCSGSALSWELCYEKAGQICQASGYEILEKDEDEGAAISGTQWGVFGGTTNTRTMIIACK